MLRVSTQPHPAAQQTRGCRWHSVLLEELTEVLGVVWTNPINDTDDPKASRLRGPASIGAVSQLVGQLTASRWDTLFGEIMSAPLGLQAPSFGFSTEFLQTPSWQGGRATKTQAGFSSWGM